MIRRTGRGRCRARRSLRSLRPPPPRPRPCHHGNSRGGPACSRLARLGLCCSRGGWGGLSLGPRCCRHHRRGETESGTNAGPGGERGRQPLGPRRGRGQGEGHGGGGGGGGPRDEENKGSGLGTRPGPRRALKPHGSTCCALADRVGAPSLCFQRPHLRRVESPRGGGGLSAGRAWALPGERGWGTGKVRGRRGKNSLISTSRAGPSFAGHAAM